MPRAFLVSAFGVDRPGIVAAITRVLAARELNVTDSQMGILRGHFAMTLVVEGEAAGGVADDLARAGDELGLEWVGVRAVEEAAAEPAEVTHTVTVYGADHPGIVAAVTGALAAGAVNVCDLRTRLTGDGVYVMVIDVAAPAGADPRELLAPVAGAQHVDVSVVAADADLL
jgi:glycine cleavage system transcriptional repressor